MNPVAEKLDVHQIMYGQENLLVKAEPLAGRRLRLEYSDGASYVLDMQPLIAKGGVMAELDNDDVFKAVRISVHGSALEFTEDLDFCADSIRVDCEFQKAGYPDPW